MYIKENVNPKGRKTGDCSTRAITKALKIPYNKALYEQCESSVKLSYGLTDTETMDDILTKYGFTKANIGRISKGQKRPKVTDIANETKSGKFSIAVCSLAGHFTVCENGNVYDIWDCSDKTVYTYWYKQYKIKEDIIKYIFFYFILLL